MRPIDAEPLEKLLHRKCAQCSNDYGSLAVAISGCLKLVQAQPTIAPPPNDPLTLEQLREMDGEPVWVVRGEGEGRWALIRFVNNYGVGTHGCGFLGFEDWQVDWWAYRRKPEELAP